MKNSTNLLRLNIGFIIHESVGYRREFDISAENIHLKPDLDLEYLFGTVKITRTADGLLQQLNLKARCIAECVRCLEPFHQELEIESTDLYLFAHQSADISDLVVPENGILDIEPQVRDEALLAIPINPQCSLECKGLCPVCGENRNLKDCNHEQQAVDPRFEVLKSLRENG